MKTLEINNEKAVKDFHSKTLFTMNYVAIPGFKRGEHNMTVKYHPSYVDSIIELVVDYFGFTFTLLQSGSRKREICYARQVLMYLLTKRTNLTLKKIGQLLGGRDHTTIIHAKATIRDLMQTDEIIRDEINDLLHKL